MIVRYVFLLFIFLTSTQLVGQNKYWVLLKSKNTQIEPEKYFDPHTLQRRILHKIPIIDSTDFPLNQDYYSQIVDAANKYYGQSRWLNAIAIDADLEQIDEISKYAFVKEVIPFRINAYEAKAPSYLEMNSSETNSFYEKLARQQLESMQAHLFHEKEIFGNKIRILIIDGGFPLTNSSKQLAHLFEGENQILGTYDFVKRNEFVYAYNRHGTYVLSNIAGKYKNQYIGLAPKANFFLARTEVRKEPFFEEELWLEAIEWADKNGVQIINSSLGYTKERYFPEDMDGKTSLVSRAANLAARKGMLVVNSLGNEGSSSWKTLGTPADADSVLSVGAVTTDGGIHSSFSSYGPTSDGRRKPNVSAPGQTVVAGKNGATTAFGTSFSAPLVSGFAACVWQMYPELSNMEVFEAIEKSAHLYPYYDYVHGYGIPQASYFMNMKKEEKSASFTYKKDQDYIYIEIQNKDSINNYLYYHIADEEGHLASWYLVDMADALSYKIPIKELDSKFHVQVFYNAYTQKITH